MPTDIGFPIDLNDWCKPSKMIEIERAVRSSIGTPSKDEIENLEGLYPGWTYNWDKNDWEFTYPSGFVSGSSGSISKRIGYAAVGTKEDTDALHYKAAMTSKCDCGAESIGAPGHSDWCSKSSNK